MQVAPDEMPKTTLVFLSTSDTINEEVPSIMAIIETFLAVGIYWWAAIHFATYKLLLLGTASAFLLLLRSDASVKLGVTWFKGWESQLGKKDWGKPESLSEGDRSLLRLILAACIVAGALIGFGITYILAEQFLVAIEPWRSFFGSFAMGFVASSVAIAMGSAIAAAARIAPSVAVVAGGTRPDTAAIALSRIGRLALAGAGAGAGAGALAGAGAIAAAGALLGAAWSALMGPIAAAASGPSAMAIAVASAAVVMVAGVAATGSLAIVVPVAVAGIPTILGSAAGVFGVSLGIRFLATLRNLWPGLLALPRNFRRLMLCTAFNQPPEFVPGLMEGHTRFTFQHMLNKYREQKELLGRMFYLILLGVWFIPGWLYRFSLKSTAWFWWPLAVLGGEARLAKTPAKFHRKTWGTLWAKTNFVVALLILAGFVVANVILKGAVFRENPLWTPFGYFLVVDRPSWQQWFVAGLAGLSLAVVYLVDGANGDYREAAKTSDRIELARVYRKLVLIEHLAKWRFTFALFWWIFLVGQMFLYLNSSACWVRVPTNVQAWAEFFYGPRTPRPPICPAPHAVEGDTLGKIGN